MTNTTALPYGATPEDWAHFGLILGLQADLLPVVSNPNATISPASKMQGLGKTPSIYNHRRQVAGFTAWPMHVASAEDIARWSEEPDYGICIQARAVRAFDVDLPERATAARVLALVGSHCPDLPRRYRANSGKCLLAFRLIGDYAKRAFKTEGGIVEFLATGQQFIACGTHPSGARYEWAGGLPDEIPELTPEQFEAVWSALVAEFATETSGTIQGKDRRNVLQETISSDPVSAALYAAGFVQATERDGRLHIACPFAEGHTDGVSAGSSTTYFPAHTGGYERGHFACLHASCAGYTDADFLGALGIGEDPADDFEILAEVPSNSTPAVGWPCAIDLAVLSTKDAAPPRFVIPDWLPEGMATLFAGHGGAGKSGIALHLASCIALGQSFFGLQPAQRRVLYLSCEDRADLLHWRLSHACKHMGISLSDLRDHLYLLDLVGKDSLLYNKDPRTGRYITPAFGQLMARIADYDAEVLFIDGIADTFAGNENSRGEVKQFVNMLVDAIPPTGALVLVGHVAKPASAVGGSAGDGYSGSTGWHNSVRARWYLYPEQTDDPGAKATKLVLALQKSNYGRTDQSLAFEWSQDSHMFVGTQQTAATPQERALADAGEQRKILQVVYSCQEAGAPVPAAMQGPSTAFAFLRVHADWPEALRPERAAVKKKVRDYMTLLVQQGLLHRVSGWSDSRNAMQCLELTDAGIASLEEPDLAVTGVQP
jgi:hypothetical protein